MAIQQLTPAQARQRQQQGVRLIDVRDAHERVTGMAEGAAGVDRAVLEAAPLAHAPDLQAPLVLICQSGRRSLEAAETLAALGYTDLASVAGGTSAWQAEGLPTVLPDGDVDLDFHETLDQRQVDLIAIPEPAGEPHAPNKFEGFVTPSEFSELGDLKQPLIQRQRSADRTFRHRPGQP